MNAGSLWAIARFSSAKEKKLLLLFFTDGEADAKANEAAFFADGVYESLEKFVLVRHEVERRCETCKRFRMTKGTKLLFLNPSLEDPAKRPMTKLNGKTKPKALKKAMDSNLKRWKRLLEKAR